MQYQCISRRYTGLIGQQSKSRYKYASYKYSLLISFCSVLDAIIFSFLIFSSIHIYNFTQDTNGIDYDDDMYDQTPDRVMFRGRLTPMDIKVFDPDRQMKGHSPCTINNAGCSHLCLAAPIPQRYTCSCPTGIRLINNRTCASENNEILLLSKRDDLRKISLDTPDFTDIKIPIISNHRPTRFEEDTEYIDDDATDVTEHGYDL